MVNILTEQNVTRSLSTLKPTDIYIKPDLGTITATNFSRNAEAADRGRAAAEAVRAQLAKLGTDAEKYAAWREPIDRVYKPKPVIDEIQIADLKRVNPAMVERLIDSDSQMILPELVLTKAPLVAQVMFFGALLSAIKSCASATLLAPSVTFTENILRPAMPHLTDRRLLFWMRAVTLVFTLLVTLYAMYSTASIFKMVENAYQTTLVAAFVPLVCGLYWRRATNQGALLSIFCGISVWLAVHLAGGDAPFVPAPLAGLIASAVGMVVGSLIKQFVPHDIHVHDRLRHGHHAADSHGVAHEGIRAIHRH